MFCIMHSDGINMVLVSKNWEVVRWNFWNGKPEDGLLYCGPNKADCVGGFTVHWID